MDHIPSLPKSFKGNTKLLLWVDLFSGYVIAKASASRTAQTVAENYEECVFRRFGASEAIRHDREPGFMSDFFHAFSRIVGQKQKATMAYRPQANGTAERMVQTLTRAVHHADVLSVRGATYVRAAPLRAEYPLRPTTLCRHARLVTVPNAGRLLCKSQLLDRASQIAKIVSDSLLVGALSALCVQYLPFPVRNGVPVLLGPPLDPPDTRKLVGNTLQALLGGPGRETALCQCTYLSQHGTEWLRSARRQLRQRCTVVEGHACRRSG